MKKNLFIITFSFLLFVQIACGQKQRTENVQTPQSVTNSENLDYPNLRLKVDEINNATLKEDFNKVIDLTYPRYVAKFGGREKTLSIIKKAVDELKNQGVEMVSFSYKNTVQIKKVGDEIYAVVAMTGIFKTPNGKAEAEDFMVGISSDNGIDWKFISGVDQKQLKSLFPEIAEKIQIPAARDPELIENE